MNKFFSKQTLVLYYVLVEGKSARALIYLAKSP